MHLSSAPCNVNIVCEVIEGAGPNERRGDPGPGGKAERPGTAQRLDGDPQEPDPGNAGEGRPPRRPFSFARLPTVPCRGNDRFFYSPGCDRARCYRSLPRQHRPVRRAPARRAGCLPRAAPPEHRHRCGDRAARRGRRPGRLQAGTPSRPPSRGVSAPRGPSSVTFRFRCSLSCSDPPGPRTRRSRLPHWHPGDLD